MCTLCHVDKYKITFKLFQKKLSRPGIIDVRARWLRNTALCYDTMPYSRITRTILTLTATVQREVRPSDMTRNKCSSLKNTLRRDRVVSCACELILLFSVVFCTVRAAAPTCAFRLIINWTPKHSDKWEVTGSYRVTSSHLVPQTPCGCTGATRSLLEVSPLCRMYWIIGIKSKLSLENKLLIHKTILKPIWTYGIPLWGTASNSNIEKLQRFQNKVLRSIVNAPRYVPNTILHTDLQIPTVKAEITNFSTKYR